MHVFLAFSILVLVVLVALYQRHRQVSPAVQIGCEHGSHGWSPDDGLGTITVSAITYKTTYENGFPPSLTAMGPPGSGDGFSCHAAGLLDHELAGGEKWGYVFVYSPGVSVDKPATGCPLGVKGYSITARPLKYDSTGRCSYYADDTGIMTFTAEDRPATPQDCCISWGCDNCKVAPDR